MAEETPRLERLPGGVALIELRSPKYANRILLDDLTILHAHLTACEAQNDIHAVILAAQGDTFSAGFDLNDLKQHASISSVAQFGEEVVFERFANRLASSRLTTVAALSGPAIGGATDLVLACDIRLGNPTASLMMPAVRFGLPLYASALERYVVHFGIDRAKSLIFTGRIIRAEELFSIGILSEIVPAEALHARCLAVATRIASAPPAPLAAMKAALADFASSAADKTRIRVTLAAAFDGPGIVARIEQAQAARLAR